MSANLMAKKIRSKFYKKTKEYVLDSFLANSVDAPKEVLWEEIARVGIFSMVKAYSRANKIPEDEAQEFLTFCKNLFRKDSKNIFEEKFPFLDYYKFSEEMYWSYVEMILQSQMKPFLEAFKNSER